MEYQEIISTGFAILIGLIIYIWKNNTKRTDDILEKVQQNLNELKSITERQEVHIENNTKEIDILRRK